ncbi:hypothetical protein GALL_537720 [mine drainage metagenome]|uniref:Uncharacterized protein n=1 Tax=mine drainage metagenome TaxID=410659 RepID=A0A1J5PB29_9ZZZZ
MPDQNGSDDDAPEPDAHAELNRLGGRAAERPFNQETSGQIRHRLGQRDPHHGALDPPIEPVADDVARIPVISHVTAEVGIFQKQPAHVRPEQVDQRRVRVGSLIRTVMVHTMRRHPSGGRVLNAADRDDCKGMLKPERALEAPVSEQPVVAKIHSESAEEVDSGYHERHASRAVEPGEECQQCQQVVGANRERISPIDPPFACTDRKRQGRYPRRDETRAGAAKFRHPMPCLTISPSLVHDPWPIAEPNIAGIIGRRCRFGTISHFPQHRANPDVT